MSKIFSLIIFGLSALGQTQAQTSDFVLEPDKVSQKCEPLFKLVLEQDSTLLDFETTQLQVSSKKRKDTLSCKISWKPAIPPNKRLLSGKLIVDGAFKNLGGAQGTIRLNHKVLGTGDVSSIETLALKEGPFSYTIEVQNLDSNNCGLDAKLVSTVSFVLSQDENWEAAAEDPLSTLDLESIKLLPLKLGDCRVKEPLDEPAIDTKKASTPNTEVAEKLHPNLSR